MEDAGEEVGVGSRRVVVFNGTKKIINGGCGGAADFKFNGGKRGGFGKKRDAGVINGSVVGTKSVDAETSIEHASICKEVVDGRSGEVIDVKGTVFGWQGRNSGTRG